MKTLPQRLFGTRPMSKLMKVAETFFSAVMLPVVLLFLLTITHFLGELNPTVGIVVDKIIEVVGVVFFIIGILFSIYGTWYLWKKIPLIKEKK